MSLSDKEHIWPWTEFEEKQELALFVKADLKQAVAELKDEIVFNDIYTADEIFRIINEKFGSKLI
jgi:hypothetical protein